MGKVEDQVKNIAGENGAALVGIASRERLLDAPPSANPAYLLPSARSCVSFAVTMDRPGLRDFLSKEDWFNHCEEHKLLAQTIYRISDRLVDFLRTRGFDAVGVEVNNNYRPEEGAGDVTEMTEFHPEFSHRYGAVAAGIGRLGWSGNVMTPQYGATVELGSVLTSSELAPDPLLEENPCDRCKMCAAVCPVEMIGKKEAVEVRVAGINEEIARKRPNTCCWIGCTGYDGLSRNGKWSNWSPYRLGFPLPEDKAELDALNIRLQKADPQMQLEENAFNNYRETMFNPDWFTNTVCGNCRGVCWEKRADREENRRLVINSGIVVLNPDGEHVISDGEVVELATPCIVKVAVPKDGYDKALASKQVADGRQGYTPMDREVLKSLFGGEAR